MQNTTRNRGKINLTKKNLKNSLLSSNCVFDYESDAQYSYLEQESEICFLNNLSTFDKKSGFLPSKNFIASKGPKDDGIKRRELRRSNGFKKDNNQSQLKTNSHLAKSLATTKQKLRAEKAINLEQSDMLK